MKKSWIRQWLVIGWLGAAGGIVLAGQENNPADYSKSIQEIVPLLNDPSGTTRQAAAIRLSLLPDAAIDAMEQAAKAHATPAAARQVLQRIVDRDRALLPARARRKKIETEQLEWEKQNTLAAYEKSEHRDPKWDALAAQAISEFYSSSGQGANARATLEKAIEAGCDDPTVVSMEATILDRAGADSSAILKLRRQAHDAFIDTSSDSYQREWAVLNYFSLYFRVARAKAWAGHQKTYDEQTLQTTRQLLDEMVALWPKAAKRRPPSGALCEIARKILHYQDDMGRDLEPVYARLQPALDAVLPNDPGPLVIRGDFYNNWAWQARGTDVAANVTDKGFKLMQERLAQARTALEKAYDLDPNDPRAANEMFTVLLGTDPPREELDKWFTRAMDADPDNFEACWSKAYFLTAKWHGSDEEELAFAKQCLEEGNWRGELPFVLEQVYYNMWSDAGMPEQGFFAQPEVWKDLQSLYEPYLKAVPTDMKRRSQYCFYACHASHWDIANAQFQAMGHEVPVLYFNSIEEVQACRHKAESKADQKAP